MSDSSKDPTLVEQLDAFDQWFRYAETIAQNRLYNLLMALSILFLGGISIFSWPKSFEPLYALEIRWLAYTVGGFGITLSLLWLGIGLRQIKFHYMIDEQIDRIIDELKNRNGEQYCKKLPIFHIRAMKQKKMIMVITAS